MAKKSFSIEEIAKRAAKGKETPPLETRCPITDCHEMVRGHDLTLYGEDGMSGVVGRQAGFLTKRAVWGFFLTFGALLLCAIVIGYHEMKTGSSCAAEAKTISQENTKRIGVLEQNDAVMKEQYTFIADSLKEIKQIVKGDAR